MGMDTSMAYYIIQILKSAPFVVFSWGFHNPVAIPNGLRFSVDGYLHSGKVEVIYHEGADLFIVRLLNADGTTKREEKDVYLDCLVNVIDGMVERCDNYKQKVVETYYQQ